jgi:hypothetical protein
MNRREALIACIAGAAGGLTEKFIGRRLRKVVYDARLGDRGIVRDANGEQIPLVISCNLQSGWVLSFVPNEHGNAQLNPLNPSELWTREGFYPCPLSFEEKPEWRDA